MNDVGVVVMADPMEPSAAPVRSYEGFFRAEYAPLVALAASISGDRSTAEDIAQEALSRAHQRWDRVSTYDKPGTWVRRVTINLALSSRRRVASQGRALLRVVAERPASLPPPPEPDTEIWKAVAALPDRQRAAVALHYLEDRSVQDIADILGCDPSTAKVHLHRGRKALAEQLGETR
jgi:RNA polymerase sigma-70 factor (ECF subfamily)